MSDHTQSNQIAERMKGSTRKLHQLASQVGSARQIREYDSDRRKNLLAKYVVKALKDGQSATAAETIGRSDPAYQEELKMLSTQLQDAETVIAQWTAEQASFDAARSLLSFSRETLRQLDG